MSMTLRATSSPSSTTALSSMEPSASSSGTRLYGTNGTNAYGSPSDPTFVIITEPKRSLGIPAQVMSRFSV